jgi:hypothetical protein
VPCVRSLGEIPKGHDSLGNSNRWQLNEIGEGKDSDSFLPTPKSTRRGPHFLLGDYPLDKAR